MNIVLWSSKNDSPATAIRPSGITARLVTATRPPPPPPTSPPPPPHPPPPPVAPPPAPDRSARPAGVVEGVAANAPPAVRRAGGHQHRVPGPDHDRGEILPAREAHLSPAPEACVQPPVGQEPHDQPLK